MPFYIIEFIVLFIIANLCYYLLNYMNKKSNKKNLKKDLLNKEVVDIRLFYKLYKIDEKKLAFSKARKIIFTISSFNLALTIVLAVHVFDNFFLSVLLGICILGITTILFYKLFGFYCIKKGYVKNV